MLFFERISEGGRMQKIALSKIGRTIPPILIFILVFYTMEWLDLTEHKKYEPSIIASTLVALLTIVAAFVFFSNIPDKAAEYTVIAVAALSASFVSFVVNGFSAFSLNTLNDNTTKVIAIVSGSIITFTLTTAIGLAVRYKVPKKWSMVLLYFQAGIVFATIVLLTFI